ncbi:MAG TPA: shikimate kinase [Daejeonella sp.]|nr:shikimate kinase [Daejeonella sp.]
MRIFLIGFMGSGKTTLGRKLAQFLQYDFVDVDKQIETKIGMSISHYFNLHGEEAFRKLEREVLQTSNYSQHAVIATGGGAPCYADNLEWMHHAGKVVYLSLPPRALVNRLKNSKTERPLLKDLEDEELLDFISQKLAEREVFYSRAKYIVSGIDLTAEKLARYLEESEKND